jgi:predicted GNAT family acetyltransferase
MNLKVVDTPDRHRFEAWSDGKLAGFASYSMRDGVIVFFHTEVDPAFEGLGVGGALARTALDESAARGLRVRALCPFIADWIARHPAYQQLTVPAEERKDPD